MAASFKQRSLAVVLSGIGSDGAMGIQAVYKMSGKVIAQDKNTSQFFDLPKSAINTGIIAFSPLMPRSLIFCIQDYKLAWYKICLKYIEDKP